MIKRYLINQVLEECLRLIKVTCQISKDKTRSNVNKQNSSRVET